VRLWANERALASSLALGLKERSQVGTHLIFLRRAQASATRIRCPFRSSTDVGYVDKRIVAAAVGANGSASLRKTGCQGILLRGEVLFIEVDAKALNPLKTTSIHNAARMVESCATNPIRGGPARKPM